MGCKVERSHQGLRLQGPNPDTTSEGERLKGVEVDSSGWPDAVLALAVAAVFAEGPTILHGVKHLRLKESDRLKALENELRKLGAEARFHPDRDLLRIQPGSKPTGKQGSQIEIHTYNDHRMAMSLALAGLRIPGLVIQNPECVAKT